MVHKARVAIPVLVGRDTKVFVLRQLSALTVTSQFIRRPLLPHISSSEGNHRRQAGDDLRLGVQMSQVAVDQITGQGAPAGILLGTITRADEVLLRIESVQPVEAFSAAAFAQAARKIPANSPLSALGYYRIDARPGFPCDPEDFEIVSRYFKEPEDLILLIYSEKPWMQGQFFTCGRADELMALGRPFPLRHRLAAFEPPERPPIRRWTSVAVLLALAGLAVAFLVRPSSPRQVILTPAGKNSEAKSMNLNVQTTGQKWLVWWNPATTSASGSTRSPVRGR